jgi:hypothetical protein
VSSDRVDRPVQRSVAASVEPVSVLRPLLAGVGAGAGRPRERGLGAPPARVEKLPGPRSAAYEPLAPGPATGTAQSLPPSNLTVRLSNTC